MDAAAPTYHEEVRQAGRAGLLLVVVGGLTGVLNLVFNVVVARGSGTTGYGAIGPLLMLGTVVGFLATGLQYAIARVVALSRHQDRHLLGTAARAVAPWMVPALLLATFSLPISDFLHLSSPVPVLLVAVMAAATVAGAAATGILVGGRRFRVIAAIVLGSAIVRIALGLLLSHGRGAVAGSILASVLPIVLAALASVMVVVYWPGPMRSHVQVESAQTEDRVGGSGVVGAFVSGGLYALWSLPLLFARHVLTPDAAGNFAAAQLLSGSIIWITAPIVTAFYPALARHRNRSAILIGLVATAALSVLGLVALTVVGPLLTARLYGGYFSVSAGLFATLALSAAATACATFGCWVALARRSAVRRTVVALALALVLEAGLDATLGHAAPVLAAGPAATLLLVVGGLGAWVSLTFGRAANHPVPYESLDEAVTARMPIPMGREP